MPTYDYECTKCSHTFEYFKGMNEPDPKKCPSCGGRKIKRLIGTGAGIIFKGSGFYETDYRRKQSKEEVKSESGKAGGEKSEACKACCEKGCPSAKN